MIYLSIGIERGHIARNRQYLKAWSPRPNYIAISETIIILNDWNIQYTGTRSLLGYI